MEFGDSDPPARSMEIDVDGMMLEALLHGASKRASAPPPPNRSQPLEFRVIAGLARRAGRGAISESEAGYLLPVAFNSFLKIGDHELQERASRPLKFIIERLHERAISEGWSRDGVRSFLNKFLSPEEPIGAKVCGMRRMADAISNQASLRARR